MLQREKLRESMRPLTERQEEVLLYMWRFYLAEDQLPSIYVMRDDFGWKSGNTSQTTVMRLHRKGYIEKNRCNKWKFTDLGKQSCVIRERRRKRA